MNKEIKEIFYAREENASREIKEARDNYRREFARDRDRILYSRAFRRLSGKTQVFASRKDDHIRNRLSHTLEVSQISRTICISLELNETLAEAIALGHDIGHTPFGHVGERTLNYIMNECDELRDFKGILEKNKGFKHNWQSIRVVSELEPHTLYMESNEKLIIKENKGLNLTDYTLWGILNHSKKKYSECRCYYKNNDDVEICTLRRTGETCKNDSKELRVDFYAKYSEQLDSKKLVTIEGLIVALADEIAQRHHDVEDALEAKIITFDELTDKVFECYSKFYNESDKNKFKQLKDIEGIDEQKATLSSFLVNLITRNVIEDISSKLLGYRDLYCINTSEDFENKKENNDFINRLKKDINFNENFKERDKIFEDFIRNRILHSHKAQCMDGKGNFIIRELFKAYLTNPQQLPDKTIIRLFDNLKDRTSINYLEQETAKDNLKKIGYLRDKLQELHSSNDKNYKECLMRTICDYISGMTDTYALQLYSNLYENN